MYPLKLFFRDRSIFALVLGLTVIVALSWWEVLTKIPTSTNQFLLHYNIIFGIDLAGSRGTFNLLPVTISALAFINLVGAWGLYGRDRVLAKILLVGGSLVLLAGIYALTLVVGLNS